MTSAPRQLICLGGTLCDERVFAPLLGRLSRQAAMWPYRRYDRVTDAATALVECIPAECVVLGFSLGGFVALDALRLAPRRVAAVILLSGNAYPDDPANAAVRRNDVAGGRREGLGAFMQGRGATLLSPSCEAAKDVVDLIADMAIAEGDEVHARQAEMNIHRPDLRPVVAASDRPILALAGADDSLCPRQRYLDLQTGPNTTLMVIAGAGHFLPLEAPIACADAIEIFLKDHDL